MSQQPAAADSSLGMQHFEYALSRIHQLDTAIVYFQKALPLLSASGQWETYTNALNALHYCYFEQDDFVQAEHYALAALRAARRQPDSLSMAYAYALNNLGTVCSLKGDHYGAVAYFRQAMQLQQALPGQEDGLADACSNLGLMLMRTGDFGQALTYVQQALRLKKSSLPKGEADPLLARTYRILAEIYQGLGRPAASDTCLHRIDELLADVAGNNIRRLRHEQYLADYYLENGRLEQATAALNRLETLQSPGQPFRPEAVAQLRGEIALEYGAFGQAQALFRRALRLQRARGNFGRPGLLANLYDLLARASAGLDQQDSCLHYFDLALHTLGASTNFLKAGDFIYPRQSLRVLLHKGEVLQKWGLYQAMLHNSQLASLAVQQLRQEYRGEYSKTLLAELAAPIYEQGIAAAWQLYATTPDPYLLETAFVFSEQSKAILLLESLLNAQAGLSLPASLRHELYALEASLDFYRRKDFEARQAGTHESERAAWEQEVFSLHLRHDSLLRVLETTYPAYYQQKYAREFSGPAALQDLLEADQLLLSYFHTPAYLYLFAVGRDSSSFYRLETGPGYDRKMRRFLQLLSQPPAQPEQADSMLWLAGHFYRKLIPPAAAAYPRLTLIPHGLLGYLPFEALLQGDEASWAGLKYQQLPWLVKRHACSYAYSATLYATARTPARGQGFAHKWLGMAPAYSAAQMSRLGGGSEGLASRSDSSYLPFAQEEVQSLKALLGGHALLKQQASEQAFRQEAGRYAILHLATHATIADRNPLYNQLFFSPEGSKAENDGLLETHELYRMHIPADLVVLSACQTGTGTLQLGEGIISLSRGFRMAGSSSLLVSLWDVPDEPTAALMKAFYQELIQGQPKDMALQRAQLAYLARQQESVYAHPRFWAGFVPLGNMEPLTYLGKSSLRYVWIAGGLLLLVLLVLLARKGAARFFLRA